MDFYHDSLLSRSISIPIVEMGGSIEKTLSFKIASLEGKCVEEGYIKQNSTSLLRYSCGVLKGSSVKIQVIFSCKIANPVTGQSFTCIVENNTRAGIKGKLDAEENPFIVFLARDHHNQILEFADIKENDKIKVVILGQRYEINDPKISIIAVLAEMYKPEPVEVEIVEPDSPIYHPKSPSEEEHQDTFVFMFKSADKAPGKGINETLIKGHSYPELSKISKWRSMLSNFHVAEFEWTGDDVLPVPFPPKTRWNSIEHAYQGAKFQLYGHKEALKFTLNSGDDIGKGDGATAQRNRKIVVLKDMSKWGEIYMNVMKSAAKAKYEQNPESMRMLKATFPAKLFHSQVNRGKKSELIHFKHLEDIRNES
jgi:predicted NAD-dependent protein-ADP-ribosyltransferase YbiA (DUF1768 family)